MKITSLSEWRIHRPPSKRQSEEHIRCVDSIPFQQLQVLGCPSRSTAMPWLHLPVMSSYSSLWTGQDIWTLSNLLFTVSACALKNNSVKYLQKNKTKQIIALCSFTGTKDEKVHVQGHATLTYKVTLEGYSVVLCLFQILDQKKICKNHRSNFLHPDTFENVTFSIFWRSEGVEMTPFGVIWRHHSSVIALTGFWGTYI